ncbi:dihydroxyacetone kinase, phosphoprotein-dependent, L subunit [Opitutaceae bacterium TAV1]|nr:dihydroxyacetone kinase [Opitutaceae bacterium TAV5]EIP98724.1 dihydroxyacetone kinase, phosphoprotein-dependent, L subunit [Opitutaceae bacterium TAV1]
MTTTLTLPAGRDLILALVDTIETNKAYLSEVDGAIGDGDHGVNMAKGFQLVKTRLGDREPTVPEALALIGKTLLTDIGGSMGPIYGTFFIQMSLASRDKDLADPQTLAAMLAGAMTGVSGLGDAKVGDKTIIDTLAPAEAAYREAIAAGATIPDALARMTEAADRGRDSTKDLVAKLGRAARLGERSRGVLDAGATSCALILKTLARAFGANP